MVTIHEVAALAGVSVATVSRVLNQSGNVAAKTKQAVLFAIEQLHYVPNMLGQHLRKNETKKILVLLNTISNQFYSRVVAGIQKRANQDGYSVMIGITLGDEAVELDYLQMLRTRLVDGVIILSTQYSPEQLNAELNLFPTVIACEPLQNFDAPWVSIDNVKAAYDAVSYLIEKGSRRIAFLGAGTRYQSSMLRLQGYIKALQDHELALEEALLFEEGFSYNAGIRAATRLLQNTSLPDAVFALSDSCAIGVIKTFCEHGVLVPDQISVMGFDNTKNSQMYSPSITTIEQPQFEIGYKAMSLLINKIKDITSPNEVITLPHKLIERDSVAQRTR